MLIDLGSRGAAVGLMLLIAAVLLRDRPASTVARLSAALAVGAAAYAISSAPGFPMRWQWWSAPLLGLSAGTPVVFWLWSRAAFDDDFVLRRWHAALWAAMVGVDLFVVFGAAPWPTLAMIGRALSLTTLGLALLAGAQALATWRVDLVSARRRLRLVVLIATLAYIGAGILPSFLPALADSNSAGGSLVGGLGLYVLATFSGWSLFQATGGERDSGLAAATADALAPPTRAIPAGEAGRAAIEPVLLRRLERLMTSDRAYRQEGLTSGMLAGKLGLPEYRLRKLINEGLGHRNFNAFLNRYRIDEAKAALADPGQKDVTVLTIAMDAGFQSIGPFNRAFKADTGLTPTEFRLAALARESPAEASEAAENLKIGKNA